mgnify:CR=1 FL=1
MFNRDALFGKKDDAPRNEPRSSVNVTPGLGGANPPMRPQPAAEPAKPDLRFAEVSKQQQQQQPVRAEEPPGSRLIVGPDIKLSSLNVRSVPPGGAGAQPLHAGVYLDLVVDVRIERRLALAQSPSIDEYLARLRSERDELDAAAEHLWPETPPEPTRCSEKVSPLHWAMAMWRLRPL